MTCDIHTMRTLLPEAAKLARPPVSNFFVGAVVRGTTTGGLYLGANLEFSGETLSYTVHAEQSAIANAWIGGERGIDFVAVTAAPCGFCRQFMNELSTAESLQISINDEELQPLSHFLPRSFGPRDLGNDAGLMSHADHHLLIAEDDDLARAALRAANMSYAPYSRSYAGVALRAGDRTFIGPYAENAAFNPSMEPLQVALSAMALAGGDFAKIEQAVLVEAEPAMHEHATRTVLATVSRVPLRVIRARNS